MHIHGLISYNSYHICPSISITGYFVILRKLGANCFTCIEQNDLLIHGISKSVKKNVIVP